MLVRDITAREEAERALGEERGRRAGILDLAPVGLYVLPNGAGNRLWRRARYRILGIEPLGAPAPPPAESWFDIIHPDERSQVLAAWNALAWRMQAFKQEYHVTRPNDGHERPPIDRARMLSSGDGRAMIIGDVEDITEQRAEQAARARLQRQLPHAQKLDALGQLTGGIAPHVNNILTSILGCATLTGLRPRHLTEPTFDEYVAALTTASERGRELIQKLLAFSRHLLADAVRTVDTAEIFAEVERFPRTFIPASIALDVRPAAGTLALRADPTELHQALVNPVVNARDAWGERGRISLLACRVDLSDALCMSCHQLFAGSFVEISAPDDGPGIAPDLLERIFGPHLTTRAFGAGSGLGLVVVHGVLHWHAGHVLVESTPGTAAAIYLAFHATASPANLDAPSRVLVVDDDRSLAQWPQEVLDGDGFAVEVVTDSTLAKAALLRDPGRYAAVVSDHVMPRRSALDLAHIARTCRPGLAVILCSGNTEALDDAEARRAGASAALRTPIAARQILAALERALAAAPPTIEFGTRKGSTRKSRADSAGGVR